MDAKTLEKEKKEKIAVGSCGSVVKQCFAVKKYHTYTSLARQRKEAAMMLLVQGSEFFPKVSCIETSKSGQPTLTITMELFESSLTQQLRGSYSSGVVGTVENIKKCMAHLLSALKHLHFLGIMHADVKPCNILVSPGIERFVLTDFSHAHWMCKKDRYKYPVSNIEYSAPELLALASDRNASSSCASPRKRRKPVVQDVNIIGDQVGDEIGDKVGNVDVGKVGDIDLVKVGNGDQDVVEKEEEDQEEEEQEQECDEDFECEDENEDEDQDENEYESDGNGPSGDQVFVRCNEKIDIYAAGLVMLDLVQVVNWHTLHGHNQRERKTPTLSLVNENKEAIIAKVGPLGHDLLLRLLDPNVDSRYTAKRALRHPYFSVPSEAQDQDLLLLEDLRELKNKIMPKISILSKCAFNDPKLIHLIMDYEETYPLSTGDAITTLSKHLDVIEQTEYRSQKAALCGDLFICVIFLDTPLLDSSKFPDFCSTLHAQVQTFLQDGSLDHIREWMQYLARRLE